MDMASHVSGVQEMHQARVRSAGYDLYTELAMATRADVVLLLCTSCDNEPKAVCGCFTDHQCDDAAAVLCQHLPSDPRQSSGRLDHQHGAVHNQRALRLGCLT